MPFNIAIKNYRAGPWRRTKPERFPVREKLRLRLHSTLIVSAIIRGIAVLNNRLADRGEKHGHHRGHNGHFDGGSLMLDGIVSAAKN